MPRKKFAWLCKAKPYRPFRVGEYVAMVRVEGRVEAIGRSLLTNTSVAIAVKPWVAVLDYVAACAEINQAIVESLRRGGVHYPLLISDAVIVNTARLANSA